MDPLIQELLLDNIEQVITDPPTQMELNFSTRHWFVHRSGDHEVLVMYRLLWDSSTRTACVVGLTHEVVPE